MRSVTTIISLALALGGTVALAGTATAEQSRSSYATQAYQATNAQRAKHHVHPVKADGCMERFATRQARVLAASGDVNDNLNLNRVKSACDLHYVIELNAHGADTGADTINDVYMGDPAGRSEVLRARTGFVGMAGARDDAGNWYFVALFAERLH